MCYLCLQNNPFDILDSSKYSFEMKKARAKLVKELLQDLESINACDDGKKEIDKLKQEQYNLSRDI